MNYKVSAADLTELRLLETDPVAETLQNVAIILATPRGSVPMDRAFGLDYRAMGKPLPVARTLLIADIIETVERYEPRAEVVNATFQEDPATPGRLISTVEVRIREQ